MTDQEAATRSPVGRSVCNYIYITVVALGWCDRRRGRGQISASVSRSESVIRITTTRRKIKRWNFCSRWSSSLSSRSPLSRNSCEIWATCFDGLSAAAEEAVGSICSAAEDDSGMTELRGRFPREGTSCSPPTAAGTPKPAEGNSASRTENCAKIVSNSTFKVTDEYAYV